jgi:hypothetical protein
VSKLRRFEAYQPVKRGAAILASAAAAPYRGLTNNVVCSQSHASTSIYCLVGLRWCAFMQVDHLFVRVLREEKVYLSFYRYL